MGGGKEEEGVVLEMMLVHEDVGVALFPGDKAEDVFSMSDFFNQMHHTRCVQCPHYSWSSCGRSAS